MALEIRQVQKLAQQLVMTPQLQQAIKLLQLSRVELEEMVLKELQENPALEEGQAEEGESGEQPRTEVPERTVRQLTPPKWRSTASFRQLTRSARWIGRSISIPTRIPSTVLSPPKPLRKTATRRRRGKTV